MAIEPNVVPPILGTRSATLSLVGEAGLVAGRRAGNCERHRLPASWAPGEDLVISVDQLDLHLVLAGRQARYVDCIAVTRIRPQPGQVVDVYVQMPETWRRVEGTRP